MNTINAIAIDWYQTPLMPGLLETLNKKDDSRGLLQASGHLCLILLTGSLCFYAYYHYGWALLLASLFLHGTVCAFLANAAHELVHGTVFNNRKLNNFFLYVFSFIRWFPPEYYWRIHTAHHQHTLYPSHDKDPELFPYEKEPEVIKKITIKEFLSREFFNPFNLVNTIKLNLQHSKGRLKDDWENNIFAGKQSRQMVFIWARCLLVAHISIAAVSLYFGNWLIPVVVSLTPCYGGWLQVLCNHAQHAGLKKNVPDFRLSCRTNYLNPVLQFLYWYMNFHIEHHMYAAVPCYKLGKLHNAIKHDLPPTLNGLTSVWQQIIAIQYRQQHEPEYCYQQQLPDQPGEQQKVSLTLPDESTSRKHAQSYNIPSRIWQCSICGFIYSEALGLPDEGIPPGTCWDSIPEDWVCPDCGTGKSDFAMEEVTRGNGI
jgi:fatty acid desaturase/rubredoxin